MLTCLTVAEDTFRGYASDAELQAAWTQTFGPGGIATLAVGTGTPASIHPAKFMEIAIDNATGSTQEIVFSRELTWTRENTGDNQFYFSLFMSADPGLAGLQFRNEQSFQIAPLVFDGAWREYDTRFNGSFNAGPFESNGFLVDLWLSVPAGVSGALRVASVQVYRGTGFSGYPVPPVAPVFPFAPDWSTPPELTIAFRTAITDAWSGDEQREQLLVQPRGRLRYTITIVDDREAALCNALLHDSAGKVFSVPLWSEQLPIRIVSGTLIQAIGLDVRLFLGQKALLLWRSPFYWESFFQIAPSAGDTVTVTLAPTLSFGTTLAPPADSVVPLRPGIIKSVIGLERPATRGMRIPLDVELLQI
jgi:hypothetical protein